MSLRDVAAFLLGEAPLDGVWFGDPHPSGKPYWWRKHMREALAEAATCRTDGRCQYAIDNGAEGMAACPVGKCALDEAEKAEAPKAEAEESDAIAKLTEERDMWARKWQEERRRYAELCFPGMRGKIKALSVEAEAEKAEPEPTVQRESVNDALSIVESYGPWGPDLNDSYRRQIVLAEEVLRLRHVYELAVRGRAEMRKALRQERDEEKAEPVAWLVDAHGYTAPTINKEFAQSAGAHGATVFDLYTHPPAALPESAALDLLADLVALVRGECPSLLDEDSDGDSRLSIAIDEALAAARGKP